jgi:hypothetical protein
MNKKLLKCPVCNKELTSIAIRNHILTVSRAEAWNNEMGKTSETPHLNYVKENYKKTNKKELEIK